MVPLKIELPDKLIPLFDKWRFKVLKGGRGGAKSWGIARALICLSLQKTLLIVCAREIQNSIKESVHRLLKNQIKIMGVQESFIITETSIKCAATGSEFIFLGLLRNIDAVKSLEGCDICWVEEAHNVSEESWDTLTPTVRKPDSEIWVSFNPKYEDDATYQKFIVKTPDNCIVIEVNYCDNPWFPDVLRKEMEDDKARDFTLYEHKWLGMPKGGGGRVWPEYDPLVHDKDFDLKEIAEIGNFYMAMDPHQHYYPACVWIAVWPMNKRANWPEDFHFHIYNEWPTFDDLSNYYHEERKKRPFTGTLLDISKAIYAKDGIEDGFKIRKRAIDTRFAKGVGSWTSSTQGIVELYAKQENGGLQFSMPREVKIDAQRPLIHQMMFYNKYAPISEYNQPQFSVAKKCVNMRMALKNHRMEDSTLRASGEKEAEKYKDMSDAMRIGFAAIEEYEKPVPVENPYEYGTMSSGSGSWMG